MIDDDSYRKQIVVDERVCLLEFADTSEQGTVVIFIVITYDRNMYPCLLSN